MSVRLSDRVILLLSSCNMVTFVVYYAFFLLSMSFANERLLSDSFTYSICFSLMCTMGGLIPLLLSALWAVIAYVRGDEVIDFVHKRFYTKLMFCLLGLAVIGCIIVRINLDRMTNTEQIMGSFISMGLGGVSYLFLTLIPERLPVDEL